MGTVSSVLSGYERRQPSGKGRDRWCSIRSRAQAARARLAEAAAGVAPGASGCSPGCLVMSRALSLILTLVVNACIPVF